MQMLFQVLLDIKLSKDKGIRSCREGNYGDGKLIYFVDNFLFRGFWYSGKQLFSNALFFKSNINLNKP